MQNVNRWKDLNSEFVISVYRDYFFWKKHLKEHHQNYLEIDEITKKFLLYHFDRIKLAIDTHLKRFDKNGTGCIGLDLKFLNFFGTNNVNCFYKNKTRK